MIKLIWKNEKNGISWHIWSSLLGGEGKQADVVELQVGGSSGLRYVVHRMPGYDVALALLDRIEDSGGKCFEEHLQVLLGCVLSDPVDGNAWPSVWESFAPMVVDSLTVERDCDVAADIIYQMFAGNKDVASSVISTDCLSPAVESAYSSPAIGPQEALLDLLTKIADFSVTGCKYVQAVLDSSSVTDGSAELANLKANLET